MSSPENFEASDHRARLPDVNAAGLTALTHAAMAAGKPLGMTVNLYAGSMMVGGTIAPPSWMHAVTKEGIRQELWDDVRKKLRKRSQQEQEDAFREIWAPHKVTFKDAEAAEDFEASADRELTLVNASVLPAIQTGNGKAGGHTLPVVRIPLSSIDVWWIIHGDTIKGSAGWSGSFGVLFPVDF